MQILITAENMSPQHSIWYSQNSVTEHQGGTGVSVRSRRKNRIPNSISPIDEENALPMLYGKLAISLSFGEVGLGKRNNELY